MAKKSIAEQSADTAVMISELSRIERGEIVTYEEHFTKWLGRPIQSREDIPTFGTVERAMRRDYGVCLSVVRGTGYRVLTHDEVAQNNSQLTRAKRAARRRKQELATVEIEGLPETSKLKVFVDTASANVVEDATSEKGRKKITLAMNGHGQPLAIAKALEALKASV